MRVKSTSSWFITSSKLTPSVSNCHSLVFPKASVCASTPVTFASRMNTFLISAIPRNARLSNICASRRFKNTSSSVDPASSPFSISLFMILMRRSNFSELSSLKMQDKSSWKSWFTRSARSAMSSFLSTIISRLSSMRKSQGDMRLESTSSSGIS